MGRDTCINSLELSCSFFLFYLKIYLYHYKVAGIILNPCHSRFFSDTTNGMGDKRYKKYKKYQKKLKQMTVFGLHMLYIYITIVLFITVYLKKNIHLSSLQINQIIIISCEVSISYTIYYKICLKSEFKDDGQSLGHH